MSTAQSNAQGLTSIILDDIGLSNDEDYLGYLEGASESGSEASTGFEDVKKQLAHAINDLPARDKIVLSLYYYDGLTLKEIGDVMGLEELKASQLHSQAVLELKRKFKTNLNDISEEWRDTDAEAEIGI